MMRASILAAAVGLVPLSAFAAAAPTPGPLDSRIQVLNYSPMQFYTIVSTGLVPVQIILEPDEKPDKIAGPFVRTVDCGPEASAAERKASVPTDWMATACENVLILAPLHEMGQSTLFLLTVKSDGTKRTYQFGISTRPGTLTGDSDRAAYMSVQFKYPQTSAPPSAAQVEAARSRSIAKEQRAVDAELAVAANTGPRNKNYWMRGKGCAALAPLYAYDDGTTTTLGFSPRAVMPALSAMEAGKETVLDIVPEQMTSGSQAHLPGVFPEIRLRAETLVCAIMPHRPDRAMDPIGRLPGDGSGTVSPYIRRELRGGR